eukprot:3549606-Pleurochrysis_carterae.AAC.1
MVTKYSGIAVLGVEISLATSAAHSKISEHISAVLKQRFWTDIYEGCKLFYLSGLKHGRYPKVRNG